MQILQPGQTVTYDQKTKASNTYILSDIVNEDTALLTHPLYPSVFIKAEVKSLNTVSAVLKDDTERCLDFANNFKNVLDADLQGTLDGLCMYFVVNKTLTAGQKKLLSNICGTIFAIKNENDVQSAMDTVNYNKKLLDDFNRMWYINFEKIFSGKKPITSSKQRTTVFNIAGFVSAQLQNPVATR
jgi:hypothetical protein